MAPSPTGPPIDSGQSPFPLTDDSSGSSSDVPDQLGCPDVLSDGPDRERGQGHRPVRSGVGGQPAPGSGTVSPVNRRMTTPERYHFGASVRSLLVPRHDPCGVFTGDELWLTARTPEGPATLHLERDGQDLVATGYGPGEH